MPLLLNEGSLFTRNEALVEIIKDKVDQLTNELEKATLIIKKNFQRGIEKLQISQIH